MLDSSSKKIYARTSETDFDDGTAIDPNIQFPESIVEDYVGYEVYPGFRGKENL